MCWFSPGSLSCIGSRANSDSSWPSCIRAQRQSGPPTGLTLAALLLLGYRVWPGIFLGAYLVNISTAGSIATSLGLAVGNTLEGLVGAYLVNRFANGRNAFDRPQDVFTFALLAGLVSTSVSATI